MIDEKEVLKALVCQSNDLVVDCAGCPYYIADWDSCDYRRICRNAIDLLKEQEPRVMDAEEVARLTEEIYQWLWIEEIQNITWNLHCLRAFVHSKHPDTGEFYILANGYRDIVKLEGDEYGKTWRCWTARPTEEQMRETKWEGDSDAD